MPKFGNGNGDGDGDGDGYGNVHKTRDQLYSSVIIESKLV